VEEHIADILYLLFFRLSLIAAGMLSLVLGYRLLLKGYTLRQEFPSPSETLNGTEITAQFGEGEFKVRNAAPGTCFAAFGVILISNMLFFSPAGITYVSSNSDTNSTNKSETTMRGGISNNIASLTETAVKHHDKNEIKEAKHAYEKAIKIMARPMNHLSWLYLQQNQPKEAQTLANIAVSLSPENEEFIHTLAIAQCKLKNIEESKKLMERIKSLEPKKQYKDIKYPNCN
jgi:tetratricopeptide (TPR) repeat protein